ALENQSLVHGDTELAAEIAKTGVVSEYGPGSTIVESGASDNEIYLLLTGGVDVMVNGRVVAKRKAGDHVGEMALIDPSAPRCATLVATDTVVTCTIAAAPFSAIAVNYPELWRRLALELAGRLRQRNALVLPPNPRPHLFIGSSVESLNVARAVQLGLDHDDVTVKIWENGVFGASTYTIEALETEVRTSDFALMVFGPDDEYISRDLTEKAPRDNVVLELGMAIGALTHKRTFLMYPRGVDLKIPTDLLGITPLTYTLGEDGNYDAAIGPVCEQIRRAIANLNVK
ncbi:MAG: nucleotide-binding protein, partial [Verrucomicrobiales bacterium]|nr:nucleotide-binding protein [Verrucomicrobiales bacterium]